MVTLGVAPLGEPQVVMEVSGNDEVRAFIAKMGLTRGSVVTVVSSRDGDLILSVKDVRVALGRDLARRIKVRPA